MGVILDTSVLISFERSDSSVDELTTGREEEGSRCYRLSSSSSTNITRCSLPGSKPVGGAPACGFRTWADKLLKNRKTMVFATPACRFDKGPR